LNTYENIVILDASLSDEAVSSAVEKIKELITASGGEVLKADSWGRRKLGYEINKHTKGFFVLFLFKAPPELIKKLEGYYKVSDTVVKFMVVKLGKKEIQALAPAAQEGTAGV